MSENLTFGQGTYHRTDMLPDSGDEVNSLWARYMAENAEFPYSHMVQSLFSYAGSSSAQAGLVTLQMWMRVGAVGTFHGFMNLAGGTRVFTTPGASNGGTFTSGQTRTTWVAVPGTMYANGWVLGTFSGAHTLSDPTVIHIWGQP